MKAIGISSTALLYMLLALAAPVYAQHEQSKPAEQHSQPQQQHAQQQHAQQQHAPATGAAA
jgi:hypothetical protein